MSFGIIGITESYKTDQFLSRGKNITHEYNAIGVGTTEPGTILSVTFLSLIRGKVEHFEFFDKIGSFIFIIDLKILGKNFLKRGKERTSKVFSIAAQPRMMLSANRP